MAPGAQGQLRNTAKTTVYKQKMKRSVAMAAHAYNPKIRESGSRTAVNLGLAWLYNNSRPAWNSIQQDLVLNKQIPFSSSFLS